MNKKYYKNLKDFDNWDNHCEIVLNLISDEHKDIVKEAIKIVEKYHDQPRYYYKWTYNRHPLRVARILLEEFELYDINFILIALFHDLAERTDYDMEKIKNDFGLIVYNGVKLLTKEEKQSWKSFRKGKNNFLI